MEATEVGERIATLRREKGLTQKQLAERIHVTDKAVSKWERGGFTQLSIQISETLEWCAVLPSVNMEAKERYLVQKSTQHVLLRVIFDLIPTFFLSVRQKLNRIRNAKLKTA